MYIATKTLEALENVVAFDQGSKFRGLLRTTLPQAEDGYAETKEPFRSHLGASLIGRKCARELWLSFRWATEQTFDGRMTRLFNRGHLEEPRFIALLLAIGCEVWQYDENGKQFRIVGHKGHFGGSLDAVVRGIPEMPDIPVLSEFKTHNDKSFQKLKGEGVVSAKPEHHVQMQIYMGSLGLTYALYLAVNKNDDEIYAEIVPFDPIIYKRYQERAKEIIDMEDTPVRINESPGWFECRFCNQRNTCQNNIPPARNCRTCRWSTPVENGEWICEFEDWRVLLDKEKQLVGCENYTEHPGIRGRM